MAIIAHAITKEDTQVPDTEIDRAITRKNLFEENPDVYTYVEETADDEDE